MEFDTLWMNVSLLMFFPKLRFVYSLVQAFQWNRLVAAGSSIPVFPRHSQQPRFDRVGGQF